MIQQELKPIQEVRMQGESGTPNRSVGMCGEETMYSYLFGVHSSLGSWLLISDLRDIITSSLPFIGSKFWSLLMNCFSFGTY